MPVEKGNTIQVPAEYFGGSQGQKVKVQWSQSFKNRSEDYWACKYVNKSGPDSDVIFVQASKLEEFKGKKIDGEQITLVVDDTFQYGQQKDGSHRFLVYHDKNNTPYQHRFMENTFTTLGGKATDFVAGLGYADASKIEDLLKHFLGDYLRNF